MKNTYSKYRFIVLHCSSKKGTYLYILTSTRSSEKGSTRDATHGFAAGETVFMQYEVCVTVGKKVGIYTDYTFLINND
jgi:hypothetical protein